MGEYFAYASLDRREYWSIDSFGGATKEGGIGVGLGGRALGLLLSVRGSDWNRPRGVPGVGAWAGTRVAVIGDYLQEGMFAPELFVDDTPCSFVQQNFRDMSSSVALMLFRHDGPDDLLEIADRDGWVLVLLSELALHHGANDLGHALRHRFGTDWKKRYAVERARQSQHTQAPLPFP